MEEQIAAIKAALAAVEAAIAQTEGALRTASSPDDVMALTSALIDLRAQRSALQLQLASLEAAAVEVRALRGMRVAPKAARGGATRMRALEKQLKSSVIDRRVSAAALAFAADVLEQAKTVRMIGDDEEPPRIARPGGKRTARARAITRPSPQRRRSR